jgi:integrase
MPTREQKGYIWREGNWWLLRYRDSVVTDGVAVRKQVSRKLAPVELEHRRLKRPPASVLELAEEFLAPLNAESYEPTKNLSLVDFGKNVWLPHVKTRCAASTEHAIRYYWEHVLAPRCGRMLLRDFSTPDGQVLLEQIARQNPGMKKSTLHKLKSMLSAIFKLAINQGYRPGPNPIRETSLPRAQESAETVAYDLDTVLTMLRLVPEPSRTVIAVAAFAGLRRGEIEGLVWEAYDGDTLSVLRGMWQGIAGEPKSRKSKAAVPVVGPLRRFLDQHRLRCGNPEAGIMFKTKTKTATPLRLHNLLNDYILPALNRCETCGEGKSAHGSEMHEFIRDESRPAWHGFHAFRRGLATNLHSLGVDDLTIQKILRHSNVAITQACYIKTLPEQTITAMKKLELLIDATSELMCSERAGTSEAQETIH